MPKRIIDFHDSVEFTGDWEFVKEKKQRIKVKAEKIINSQIYMIFNEVVPLYTFLYFALAPQEAFEFQKVQSILDKMRENQEQKQKFQECKRSITLNWDGMKPLANLIRQHKKHIIKEQKNIYDLSSKITEQEAKTLLRSGLSQRKVHLDYHTNDGEQQQAIIPTIQNIDNCISIIFQQRNHKYLLAFFCHIQQNVQQLKQQETKKTSIDYQEHNVPHTFKDRPLPTKKIANPDDRPLPKPQDHYVRSGAHQSELNKPIPTHPRQIVSPDQRLLPQPQNYEVQWRQSGSNMKQIINPDDRLLPQPPAPEKHQYLKAKKGLISSSQNILKTNQNKPEKINKKVNQQTSQLKNEASYLVHSAEDKLIKLGENAKNLGIKVQHRVEQIVEDIKHDKHNWVNLGVSAVIIGMFIKTLRA